MTTEQRADDRYVKEPRFDELTRQRRRQLLTIAGLRSLASVAVLVTAYFLLPFTRLLNGRLIVEFAAGACCL